MYFHGVFKRTEVDVDVIVIMSQNACTNRLATIRGGILDRVRKVWYLFLRVF